VTADHPVEAELSGKTEHHCHVDGVHGEGLAEVRGKETIERPVNPYSVLFFPTLFQVPGPATGPDGVGPVFNLPQAYDSGAVARHFYNAHERFGADQAASRSWLADNFFTALVPPALLYAWWRRGVVGTSDLLGRIIYDSLHCFFIGLLARFTDTIPMIIRNNAASSEAGNVAVGLFDARIAALPSHDTGLRLYRAAPRGFTSRPIHSGNDRFFAILMFVAAIGLDDRIIPAEDVRTVVLSSCEAAAVVAHLLRAEALTPAARTATYTAVRRFLMKLHLDAFRLRQLSSWEIIKFHMLLHIVNWLGRGAPASTNSSKFEATLRIYFSRILKRASANQNVMRDIANYIKLRTAFDLLQGQAGAASEALASAAVLPARRRLVQRCRSVAGGKFLIKPMPAPPAGGAYLTAISADWANVPGNAGAVPGTAVDFSRARFFSRVFVNRIENQFVAIVDLRKILELNPRSERFAAAAAAPAGVAAAAAGGAAAAAAGPDPEAIRDDPARVKLARLLAIFYLPPPAPGGASDGFPDADAAGPAERTFVLVHPFADEAAGDAGRMGRFHLKYHAVRHPVAAQIPPGAGANAPRPPPFQVFPLRDVLGGTRALPAEWPVFNAAHDAMYTTEEEQRAVAAACRTGPVLIFLPPTRGTYWPLTSAAVGEGEDDEGEGSDEDEDV